MLSTMVRAVRRRRASSSLTARTPRADLAVDAGDGSSDFGDADAAELAGECAVWKAVDMARAACGCADGGRGAVGGGERGAPAVCSDGSLERQGSCCEA